MKKLLLSLLFLISSVICYSQIDYNIYIGSTKKEITSTFKRFGYKYTLEQKMYVTIDSTGGWKLDDQHYTWLIYYSFDGKSTNRSLFMFNSKGICEKYYILMPSFNYFWDYFDLFNSSFKFIGGLMWEDDDIRIHLRTLTSLESAIFIEKK